MTRFYKQWQSLKGANLESEETRTFPHSVCSVGSGLEWVVRSRADVGRFMAEDANAKLNQASFLIPGPELD
jgi:hypothetical protein